MKIHGQNLIEKIAQQFAVGLKSDELVRSGDYISVRPAYVMTHDNTTSVISKFKAIGAKKMANPRQVVFTQDHNIQDKSDANLKKYKSMEDFARQMGVDFYPAGRGIGHQIMCEEGYAWPGTMVVASDSHSNTYGGLACLGTPVVRTDAAAIWATGRTWWQVPPVAKVELQGRLPLGVSGKDIIITLCGLFSHDEVLNHAVEFVGDAIATLSIEERLTIANMSTEWGALAGVFPFDDITCKWLQQRADFIARRGLAGVPSDEDGSHPRLNSRRIGELASTDIAPDANAHYAKELILQLDSLRPHVCGPDDVKIVHSVLDLTTKNIKIHKAYVVSCVNSRVEDLAQAANVVANHKVAAGVKFYIAAASSEVEEESKRRGDWQKLLDAGATALPPGCGPCIGLGAGLLEDDEVGISATNRNFKGRMGSARSQTYLASPAVVAASAIAGKIAMPQEYDTCLPRGIIHAAMQMDILENTEISIVDGFPQIIEGEVVFCHQDNMNTDGIYPGKYTYKDDISPQEQAQVVMENYDPEFGKLVKHGDILVGGYNFGTGSSREQAATALKYRGIQLVIAGSFSETYKRNAINNGFLTVDSPDLVDEMKKQFGIGQRTIRTNLRVHVDFRSSSIESGSKKYRIGPIGSAAQELILAGGLESWVKQQLAR